MKINTSSLLISDYPIQVLPKLAEKIGLNEAIVLQQLHYWLGKTDNQREGVKWVYNSYPEWKEQFQFWSIPTIQRIFKSLEMHGLIKVGNFNKMRGDLTKWYTIDYEGVEALETSWLLREKFLHQALTPSYQSDTPSYQIDTKVISNCDDASYQNDMAITIDYVPEITTKTSSSAREKPTYSFKKEKQEPTENKKIYTYFAKAINCNPDTLSRMDYEDINKLVAEGFTLERCQPGIDETVKGIRSRPGGVVRTFRVCEKSIRQLDPLAVRPISIQQPQVKSQAELDNQAQQQAYFTSVALRKQMIEKERAKAQERIAV